ncbi:MAG: DUF1634 domain-containing protein [Planctomycetaceae bacterium]|nr:DUF1634 domain-containing protein [Planctomycetaceae bacterium]
MTTDGRPRRLEHAVHRVLVVGLAASGLLLIAGLVVALVGHSPPPEGPPPISAPLRGAAHRGGSELMELGLLLLIATPVFRVAVLGVDRAREGKLPSAAVARAVPALLGLSFVLGVG